MAKLHRRWALLCVSIFACVSPIASAVPNVIVERPDWEKYFAERGVIGTMVVFDQRSDELQIHHAARAARRFVPASTFKVPHALFALETGIVEDEFQIFVWDGEQRSITAWNRDQTLRSSMRHSVVWVYQQFARALGEGRERALLERIDYGNADPGGGIDRFWLDGALRISAIEQVRFLHRLQQNALPFDPSKRRLVKDLMIIEAQRDWILRAKTGWGLRVEPEIGWFVGWVDRFDHAIVFALNIEMPPGGKHLAAREDITRAILAELGAFQ